MCMEYLMFMRSVVPLHSRILHAITWGVAP